MSPIAFGVSDYPPAIRRLFWFGGPRFASLAAAAVGRSDLALPLDTVALCLESPCHLVGVWFSASPMRAGAAGSCQEECCASLRLPRASLLASVSFSGVSIDQPPSVSFSGVSPRSDRSRSSLTSRALQMPCPRSG